MTKSAALQAFFDGLGIPAYPASDVPDDVTFPWLSYTAATDSFGREVAVTVDLWDYGDSNVRINALAQQLSEQVTRGGVVMPCDGGAIWIKRGEPWCQSLRDASDGRVKRRYINMTAEYLTTD